MDIHFEVLSGLGRRIRISREHWKFIVQRKHLEMSGRERDVQQALIAPEAVRISQEDEDVYLYYRKFGRHFICVVCRHFNGEGFVITCYLTDKAKEGKQVWPR